MTKPAPVIGEWYRRPGGESFEGRIASAHRLVGELLCGRAHIGRRREDRVRGQAALEGERVLIVRVAEGDQLGKRSVGQGGEFGIHQGLVGAGRAAHRLGRIVDEDVERPGSGDRVGETDDLGRISQVDSHDAQSVDPLR